MQGIITANSLSSADARSSRSRPSRSRGAAAARAHGTRRAPAPSTGAGDSRGHARGRRAARASSQPAAPRSRALGRYVDARGRLREVVSCRAAGGSVLVIDRDAMTLGGRRLVGHLASEEPATNASLLCAHYLADPSRGRCRPVAARDLEEAPLLTGPVRGRVASCSGETSPEACRTRPDPPPRPVAGRGEGDAGGCLVDARGRAHWLAPARGTGGFPELRWQARSASVASARTPARVVSLREVVGRLESYAQACAITRRELARQRSRPGVGLATLRAELRRVEAGRIVLNRGLREAVLAAVEREAVTLSEIALRCGRVRRDGHGLTSGQTTWVARRIGLVPDSGRRHPSPWVHSDVLGLIARAGLGLSPLEVELG